MFKIQAINLFIFSVFYFSFCAFIILVQIFYQQKIQLLKNGNVRKIPFSVVITKAVNIASNMYLPSLIRAYCLGLLAL